MSNKKVRVGIIGAGAIADIAHLPSLKANQDVEMVSVLTKTAQSAEEAVRKYGIQRAVQNLDQMLKTGVDCVFLLTPKTVRKEYLIPLMEAKIDIFCEKPLAMTLSECEMLADFSAKTGNIMMVGFNRRFAPVYRKAKAAFDGRIPEFVYAEKNREFIEYRGTMENAIHMIDLLRYMCGESVKVDAQARYHKDAFHEHICTAQISFDSGAIGLLGASRSAGQWVERMELYGYGISVFAETPDSIRIVDNEKETVQTMTPLAQGWAKVEDKLGFKPCVDHFIECVRTREKPLTCAEDAFKTHKLLNEILVTAGLPDMSSNWEDKR
jgi:virulence factor